MINDKLRLLQNHVNEVMERVRHQHAIGAATGEGQTSGVAQHGRYPFLVYAWRAMPGDAAQPITRTPLAASLVVR